MNRRSFITTIGLTFPTIFIPKIIKPDWNVKQFKHIPHTYKATTLILPMEDLVKAWEWMISHPETWPENMGLTTKFII